MAMGMPNWHVEFSIKISWLRVFDNIRLPSWQANVSSTFAPSLSLVNMNH
jgi:hypothetical protein